MSLLVLDTSAVVAYAEGSVHVGEPIAEVDEGGGMVLLPAVCMIEAAIRVGDDMPAVLAMHAACSVVGLSAGQWTAVTVAVRALGRLDLACALVAASAGGGYILTGEPDAYGPLGGDLVIPI